MEDDNSALITAYFDQVQTVKFESRETAKDLKFHQLHCYYIWATKITSMSQRQKNDKVTLVHQSDRTFYEFISSYGKHDNNLQIFKAGNNN